MVRAELNGIANVWVEFDREMNPKHYTNYKPWQQ